MRFFTLIKIPRINLGVVVLVVMTVTALMLKTSVLFH
jgi:hypothetical protein